jgi:hypothetical protein
VKAGKMSLRDIQRDELTDLLIARLEGAAEMLLALSEDCVGELVSEQYLLRQMAYHGAVYIMKAVRNGTQEQIFGGLMLAKRLILECCDELRDPDQSWQRKVIEKLFPAMMED